MYFNKQDKQISFDEWREKNNDHKYKNVAQDRLGKHIVSTTWTGLNINTKSKKNFIFDTSVYCQKLETIIESIQCKSLKDSLEKHHLMVKKYKE